MPALCLPVLSYVKFLGDLDQVTDYEIEGDGGGEAVGDKDNEDGHNIFHLELHVAGEVVFEVGSSVFISFF